ncbi:MAG: hypothetical protein ACRD3W_09920, partial [Terriglobales bacterium]
YLHLRALGKEPPDAPGELPPAQLRALDKQLLLALHKIYFPVGTIGRGEGDFSAGRFAYQLAFQGIFPGLRLFLPGHSYSFEELGAMAWPVTDPDIEDLLYRYFYSRIFGKLYFGAGFGQLSLVAGFQHLLVVYALIKLHAKALSKSRGASVVSYVDVVATIRQLEKRLGETVVGGYGAAIYELLLFSYRRAQRLLAAT